MKKSYSKAEAFKVSFNANEQVAAACQYIVGDTAKYTGTPIGDLCVEFDGQYGSTEMMMCYILDDGTSPYMQGQYSLT